MNHKPQKSWSEIQMAIATLAFSATLAFWNLFATPQKTQDPGQSGDPTLAPSLEPTQAPSPTPGFVPVKIIFGGPAPKQQVVIQQTAAQPRQKSGAGAPKPAASTGSSKP